MTPPRNPGAAVRALLARRHVRIGDAARDALRWAEARAHYERALAATPSMDHIWVQLGHARKELGALRAAEAAYAQALGLRPDTPDTHLQLGHLLKVSGRLEEAVESYAAAARLDPDLIDARRELTALGYSAHGRRVFGARFEGPDDMRRSAGAVMFEALLRLDGIGAADALHLVARHGLRVGYRLHGPCSTSPATDAGHAAVEELDAETLRCRFVLPDAMFGDEPVRLVQVGLLYEDCGSTGDWDEPGTWFAVGTDEVDLFGHYQALVAERDKGVLGA